MEWPARAPGIGAGARGCHEAGAGWVLTEAEGDQAPGGQARGGVSWVRKEDRATARRLGGVEGKIIPGNK